ncbi:hypothetical protein SAMD00019534_053930, partial [Acytostelium subglobosum LB1]|uniref:hypothetical protein n=1 Tax=Acytostelium subglobosum LB1 TaxID=1410327 RepID=UPI00064516F4
PTNQKRDTLVNKPYCSTCGKEFGLFTSKIACDLCYINYCSACITKLSSKDITGVLREGQTKNYCVGCQFIVTREENNRRYETLVLKAKDEPLFVIYIEITLLKRAIHSGMPGFEYLASSISDFTTASPKNRETFLQVYDEVMRNQVELATLFKDFDRLVKAIANLQTTSNSQEIVKANMKHVYVNFLQQYLPKFKTIQSQVQHVEMNTATNMYMVLCRNVLDNQLNAEFWDKYGGMFQNAVRVCRNDLFNAAIKCGEDWEKHKSLIDTSICQTNKSYLSLDGHPSKELEGTLVRKNAGTIKKILDQVSLRVTPEDLVQSRKVLQELYLTLSREYERGLVF